MNSRREFIKTGLALGAALSLADLRRLCAAGANASDDPTPIPAPNARKPVLIAVRDGDRVAMLDKAMAELGGMEAFVKPGQTVVLKPNISFDAPPERGSNTHPDLPR